jgi:hypothetical protein
MNIDFSVIIDLLTSEEIQKNIFPIKVTFLIISGLFLAFVIFASFYTHYFKWMFLNDAFEFLTRRPFGAKRMNRNWKKIKQRLDSKSETEYKLAIIEADKMLSSALKRMGYAGPTLEESLDKLTSATLPNIEDLYSAHQLRENIVRDQNYAVSFEQAKKILDDFENAFIHLQLLS